MPGYVWMILRWLHSGKPQSSIPDLSDGLPRKKTAFELSVMSMLCYECRIEGGTTFSDTDWHSGEVLKRPAAEA